MKLPWLSAIIGNVSNISALYDEGVRLVSHHIESLQEKTQVSWFSPNYLLSRLLSSSCEKLEHIFYALLVYFLVCLALYKLTFRATTAPATNTNDKSFWRLLKIVKNVRLPSKEMQRVLFVIAHPDDECMFFGPLIYSLAKREGCQVYVLCLSNGNYEQKAQLRRQELWASCKHLGIPAANVILVNATHFPDDPNVDWRRESVATMILNTVESLDIQAVVTFDPDGVSQHPNHCAVYYATASLCLANLLPKDCKFYTLDSINLLRKYISIFDLLCTCFLSTNWCILSWEQAKIIRRAMQEHQSQMKWFRWLYIYFSRYMFINSVREVNLSDVELEMQIHETSTKLNTKRQASYASISSHAIDDDST